MEPTTKKPTTADLKPGAKPESRDDLKSIPMADVEKKLGSSPDVIKSAQKARCRLLEKLAFRLTTSASSPGPRHH